MSEDDDSADRALPERIPPLSPLREWSDWEVPWSARTIEERGEEILSLRHQTRVLSIHVHSLLVDMLRLQTQLETQAKELKTLCDLRQRRIGVLKFLGYSGAVITFIATVAGVLLTLTGWHL